MNYLAHLFLSGSDEQIMVGNFISDYVKGNEWQKYPENVAKGIIVHRQIDSFTDTHAKFREAKMLFRAEFGLYSGILVDFLYDHFLAKNWNNYSDITLRTFTKRTHAILLQNFGILPLRVQGFLPFLIQHRRLESYATVEGIIQAYTIMSKYSSLPMKPDFVKKTLNDNYKLFELNFKVFMHEIISYINNIYQFELKDPEFDPVNSNY